MAGFRHIWLQQILLSPPRQELPRPVRSVRRYCRPGDRDRSNQTPARSPWPRSRRSAGFMHQDRHIRLASFSSTDLHGRLLGVGLDIIVQADLQVAPGTGFDPRPRPRSSVSHPRASVSGQDRAVRLPLQVRFILHLQADDALIVAAGKAQHLGSQAAVADNTACSPRPPSPLPVVKSPDAVAGLFVHVGTD